MRAVLKALGIVLALFLVLIVIATGYSTFQGYTTWWFPGGGSVRVDGKSDGYLHIDQSGKAVIVTRTDVNPTESYFISLTGRRFLIDCGLFHPPRFLPFSIGDVNPPCSGLFFEGSADESKDHADISTLSVKSHRIQFSTQHGKQVVASW